MSTARLRQAIRLYRHGPRSTRRHNQKMWLRSVHQLGDRWLLAVPIRKEQA